MSKQVRRKKENYFIRTEKEIIPVKPKTVFKLYRFTFFTHRLEGWKLTNKETGRVAYDDNYWENEEIFIKKAKQFLYHKGKKELTKIINYFLNKSK